jgi:hypothetical protein
MSADIKNLVEQLKKGVDEVRRHRPVGNPWAELANDLVRGPAPRVLVRMVNGDTVGGTAVEFGGGWVKVQTKEGRVWLNMDAIASWEMVSGGY